MNFSEIRVQIVCEMDLVLDPGLTISEIKERRWGRKSYESDSLGVVFCEELRLKRFLCVSVFSVLKFTL